MTKVRSRGTGRGRIEGGDSVMSANPSPLPGAFASSDIAALVGRRSGRRFRLGDKIAVRVEQIAKSEGKIELAPA